MLVVFCLFVSVRVYVYTVLVCLYFVACPFNTRGRPLICNDGISGSYEIFLNMFRIVSVLYLPLHKF